MKKYFYLFLFTGLTFGITGSVANAQQAHKCYTDEMVSKSLAENPHLLQEHNQLEVLCQQADQMQGQPEAGTLYIIPIVFHVVHNYGFENISDAQIIDAVRILNEDYRKLNADTANVVASFQGIIADSEIEFRLATKDPNGNCTNGIDRIVSTLTYVGNDAAKLNPWPRNKYLNVWIVADLVSGAAAYAYLPGTAPSSSVDGIIGQSNYFGSIGTGSYSTARVLTHEVGHFLNLLHPWGSTNSPGVSCGDDGVSDTPETMGATTCNINLSVCNPPAIENVQNHMDYAYCDRMFTEGQKTRMRTALTNTAGQRNQLWTTTNLTATGALTSPAPICKPTADFSANSIYVCSGSSVTFTDLSYNGTPTGWDWTFTGGVPATSTAASPVITYSTPGTHNVSMTSTNSTGSSTKTKNTYIEVLDATVKANTPHVQGFENAGFPNFGWTTVNTDAGAGWIQTNTTNFSGVNSVYIKNFSGNPLGEKDAFISPLMDFTLSTVKQLTFRLAYAQTATSDNDQLTVSLSTNCGATWGVRYTKSGASLATRAVKTTSFTPASATEWRTETVSISPYANSNNARIKFEFTSGSGNNIYLDDICILGVLGQDEIDMEGYFADVFPNPVQLNSVIEIGLPKSEKVSYSITDILGREQYRSAETLLSGGDHQLSLNTQVASGLYFINIYLGDKKITKKVIVSK